MLTNSGIARFANGRRATALACAVWFGATFTAYFLYAGRIESFDWNAVEFIIANHLRDFGRYALGASYPAAIWRPVGPTFMVLAIDSIARDPVLTYQLLAGLALASFVTSTYLLNRLLFGQLLAHAGAALAFATPLVSVLLINHTHSISHLCFLAVASPTLLASVICIVRSYSNEQLALWWLWLAAAGWILCYLCRPESVLMAIFFFLAVAALAFRRRQSLRTIIAVAIFAVGFAGFNLWASANAARDDIWSRKPIYLFYSSQGWTEVFENRDVRPQDHESAGYLRAIELYGNPSENGESILRAIVRNPMAFADRVKTNLRQSIDLLVKGKLISLETALLLAALPLGFLLLMPPFRLLALFAAALCSVGGIFLIFHIDDRYFAIVIPATILLASLGAYGLNRLSMPARLGRNAFALVLLVVALLHLTTQLRVLSDAFHHARLDLSALRQIGEGFRNAVRGSPEERQQMIVHLDILPRGGTKSGAPLLLFPYFAHTSLALPGSEGPYPRDRLFSLPQCPATHAVVSVANVQAGTRLGTIATAQAGELAVVRLAARNAPSNRFCATRAGG